jgi:hypothetical protein
MKKLSKTVCSVLFATSMAFPANALANPNPELDDAAEERVAQSCEDDQYNMAFLSGDFDLYYAKEGMTDQIGTMVMFLSGPNGKIIKDAQVVTTIIAPNGSQQMRRARPVKGGYLIETEHLPPGQYRLEAEIITAGRLLTDEIHFQKA